MYCASQLAVLNQIKLKCNAFIKLNQNKVGKVDYIAIILQEGSKSVNSVDTKLNISMSRLKKIEFS
jgi:hypothetical protein